MRTDLDHLPDVQQQELAAIRQILLDEFSVAIAQATSTSRRNAKVYKIILFGSYARNDWVDEPDNGYQSDYDLLIVVSHKDVTDIADYWYVAEDRILRDTSIGRPVNIIVHSLDEVNQALTRGEYFWIDIARDGIALYELPCHPLATPMPLTPTDAYQTATGYFERNSAIISHRMDTFAFQLTHAAETQSWRNEAAFMLHQAVEAIYACQLLVQTLYFPRSHNIKFLRSLAEDKEPRLIDAWPRANRLDRSRFERLKRAYVEARYSASYVIHNDDLDALASSVAKLRGIVDELCRERLAELQAAARA
jgi:predicted nucleotidyltransferase/HEPN domain-containing protein